MKKTTTVEVEIPSGVADGDVFSVKREGSRMLGQAGDLLINISVDKSELFTRKKNDVFVTIPISLYQALVGGTVIVPTINGDVEMKIPPGSQPDDIKRLNGRGIFNSSTSEQGHQFIKFKVEIPRGLTQEQQELLERCFNPNSHRSRSKDETGKDYYNPPEEKKDNNNSGSSRVSEWLEKLWRRLKWY